MAEIDLKQPAAENDLKCGCYTDEGKILRRSRGRIIKICGNYSQSTE